LNIVPRLTTINLFESYRAEESDMSMRSGGLGFALVGAGLIAFFGLAPISVDAMELTASVTITAFDDRYVESGHVYDDLNKMERQIALKNPRSITILICGAGATRTVKAAVHRFRNVPVQLRVPDIDEEVCMSLAALAKPTREGTGSRPIGIDDIAVDTYWRELIP
jgi:hypothetical protein